MSQMSFFDPSAFGLENLDFVQEGVAVSVIVAAGGHIDGRIRLQKLVFLLDKLGLNSGFSFTYHHYGPFSSDLAGAVDTAKAFGLIHEKFKHREIDGVRYSSFSLGNRLESGAAAGFLSNTRIRGAVDAMKVATSTVLELAATAYWLKHDERREDWRMEIVRRKGQKTEQSRLEIALKLLTAIGLALESSQEPSPILRQLP